MIYNCGEYIDKCIDDAKSKFCVMQKKPNYVDRGGLMVYSWPQSFGDTSCGFGGMAGQTLTTPQVVIVCEEELNVGLVYVGRFAYAAEMDNAFMECLGTRSMPGKIYARKKLKLVEIC